MNKVAGLTLLIAGAGMFFYGWRAHAALAAGPSDIVVNAPIDKVMWFLCLGTLTAAAGLYALVFRGVR